MISVIIPVYNVEQYLARCLDAVLCSTYPDFELLLINDGSTDRSPEICAEYARRDSRVKLFSQDNRGVSAARNRGLEECAGEWIVFVDGDDVISRDFLQLVAAEDCASQDMILFDFAETEQALRGGAGQPGAPEKIRYAKSELPGLLREMFRCGQLAEKGNVNLNSSNARAFKRSLIQKYGIQFPPELRYGEDTIFDIEYQLKADSCVYIRAPVYFYNVHGGSSSYRIDYLQEGWKEKITKAEAIKSVLEKNGIFPLFRREYYSYILDNLTFILIWAVFNPENAKAYKDRDRLWRELRQDGTCRQALRWNWSCGPLRRRIFLFPFHIKCRRVTGLLCRLGYLYLKKWKPPHKPA